MSWNHRTLILKERRLFHFSDLSLFICRMKEQDYCSLIPLVLKLPVLTISVFVSSNTTAFSHLNQIPFQEVKKGEREGVNRSQEGTEERKEEREGGRDKGREWKKEGNKERISKTMALDKFQPLSTLRVKKFFSIIPNVNHSFLSCMNVLDSLGVSRWSFLGYEK